MAHRGEWPCTIIFGYTYNASKLYGKCASKGRERLINYSSVVPWCHAVVVYRGGKGHSKGGVSGSDWKGGAEERIELNGLREYPGSGAWI